MVAVHLFAHIHVSMHAHTHTHADIPHTHFHPSFRPPSSLPVPFPTPPFIAHQFPSVDLHALQFGSKVLPAPPIPGL